MKIFIFKLKKLKKKILKFKQIKLKKKRKKYLKKLNQKI